jgi:hypothetical protein
MTRHKLCRELDYENIPAKDLCKALGEFADFIVGGTTDWEANSVFESFCSMRRDLGLLGTKIGASSGVSRIMTLRALVHFHDNSGDSLIDDSTDDLLRRETLWQKIVDRTIEPRRFSGPLRGSSPLFWVTVTQDLDRAKRGTPAELMPDRIRDMLGLSHGKANTLVEVRLPVDLVTGLRTPTIFDAPGSAFFVPGKCPDGWGSTVDLRTLNPGLPEAVHPSLEWAIGFEVWPVGPLNTGPIPAADPVLADLLHASSKMFNEAHVLTGYLGCVR